MADSGITKRALAAAMKQLMQEQPFAKISIGEICELCQMNRKSFYYHFKDKYELVNWIYASEIRQTLQDRQYAGGKELLRAACEYLYENRVFYANALEVQGQNSFGDYFREQLRPGVQRALENNAIEGDEGEFFVEFYTEAVVGAIERWLQKTPVLPPEEFVQLLSLAVGGFAGDIAGEEKE